jgi:hypothetical protein
LSLDKQQEQQQNMMKYGVSSSSLSSSSSCLRMQRIFVSSSSSSSSHKRTSSACIRVIIMPLADRCNSSSSSSSTRSSFVTATTTSTNTFTGQLKKRAAHENAHSNTINYKSFSSSSSSQGEKGKEKEVVKVGSSLKMYYHIEASNAERPNATKLTVHGPDVDGILASMTVALAVKKGCSLVELHAAATSGGVADDDDDYNDQQHNNNDMLGHAKVYDDDNYHFIHDVFWVVQRANGQAFPDDQLHDLALCLLEAAQSPMTVVTGGDHYCGGVGGKQQQLQDYLMREQVPVPKQQITVIPSTSSTTTKT